MQKAFLTSVQNFIVNGFSISIVRRMGPTGTLDCIRTFLKEIDLSAVSKRNPSQYSQLLDELTEKLQHALPKGAKNWGVARKCLNLFFRDVFYNFYTREAFDLAKFEAHFEVPLDSNVGRALRHENSELPRWRTVKGLTRNESDKFQAAAAQIAKREKTQRVHLDIVYWRGEKTSK
jgi:hypothetical protein